MSRRETDPREQVLPLVPQLRAYARALATRNPDLADDLVQDTLMLALQAWQSFTPGTNLKGWLFQILHNRFHSVISRKHVKSEVASDNLEWLATVPAHQEKQPEVSEFKVAFAHLSPNHREALVLHAIHGLPYERIAEICGCEVGTVKSRINRARNQLKEMLLGEGEKARSLRSPPPLTWRKPRRPKTPPPAVLKPSPVAEATPAAVLIQPKAMPAWRLPWVADAEREIARAEVQLTRHRQIVTRLSAVGLVVAGAEAALQLAERRLVLLNTHRQHLLETGTSLRQQQDLPFMPAAQEGAGSFPNRSAISLAA
jgi:RNA polymerase sigma-70 factor (ECF subfamily)